MDPYKVMEIPVKDIHPAKGNRAFGSVEVKELQTSIKEIGLINPILVEKNGDGYIIVAGHRRFEACKKLKWETIPASVLENSTDTIRIVDNVQRTDIHPMDEALELENLVEKLGNVGAVAAAVGKSKSYVYSRLRLSNLCEGARDSYKLGSWSHDVFMELARLTEEQQKKMLDELGHMWNANGSDARRRIQELFFMKLSNAPFDIKNPVISDAGSCVDCPKRAKNNDMLFEDIVSTDTCTDHICWKDKRMKNYNQQLKALKEAGEEIHLLSDETWNVAIDKIAADKWKESKKKEGAKKGLIAAGYDKGKIIYFDDLRTKKEIKDQTPEQIKKRREARRQHTEETDHRERRCIDEAINEHLKEFLSKKTSNKRIRKELMINYIQRFQWHTINNHFDIGAVLDTGRYYDEETLKPIKEWLKKNLTEDLFKESILPLMLLEFITDARVNDYSGHSYECKLAESLGFNAQEAVIQGTQEGLDKYHAILELEAVREEQEKAEKSKEKVKEENTKSI